MKKICVAVWAIFLSGCTSASAANYINGNYFMSGDVACKKYKPVSSTRIMCANSKGNITGYRDAMTSSQLQMYLSERTYQKEQVNELTKQLQETSDSFSRTTQAIQQTPTYTAPQATDPRQPDKSIKCLKAGIYVNCRN